MKIEEWNFNYACEIIPDLDTNGNPIEYFPQARYENRENHPLSKYGKGPFCKFTIDRKYARKSGVYALIIDESIHCVGQCVDLQKRFGMGYGNISPRNCFDGGQPTNCRINSDILKMIKSGKRVQLYFLETEDRCEIERKLLRKLRPAWNKTTG